MKTPKRSWLPALKMIAFFTLLTGILYPLLVTGLAQLFFPYKANGSLQKKDGKIIGSQLIGQSFRDSVYFWPRPSGTDFNALPGGGSNLGPTSAELKKKVDERRKLFISGNHLSHDAQVPLDMLYASGSGLDPHISKESALLQVNRVAEARKFDYNKTGQLRLLVDRLTEEPQFSFLGKERVNVFMLNLELDKMN